MIEYQMYYQPEGTVMKSFNFNKDNDFQAIEYAKDYCGEHNVKLIALNKIVYKRIL